MRLFSTSVSAIALSVLLADASGAAPRKINLLGHETATLVQDETAGITAAKVPLIHDGDDATQVQLKASASAPVEMVFSFGDQIVAPEGIRIKLMGLEKDQARIEVLVSNVSAVAGYSSLRVEPLRKTNGWQSFSFDQTAAKWVMIRVEPFDKDVTFKLSELELRGHAGAPVTVYEFDETPADAIELLSQLKTSIDVGITDDEASLFKDAADGTLDEWSFAEASLLSSGIHDKAARTAYLAQIDALEAASKQAVSQDQSDFDKGRALLEWLHSGALKAGYVEHQTDVSVILDGKTYNCVSSATLYNILARRMGLDARGIEVPDHAFSILYDGSKHADVETTTKAGFNPARNKAGLTEFARKTGFVYINDKNRSKRREIGDAGMVALTYYNHGVGLSEEKKYQEALLNYFRALSLDPKSKSSVKNALSALSNWSVELLDQGDLDAAITILETGLELAPNDRNLRHNLKAIWQSKVEEDLKSGDVTRALASLRGAYDKTNDKSFLRMQSWVFQSQGEALIEKGDWDGAMTLAQDGIASVDEAALRDLKEWRSSIVLRRSNVALNAQDFATAMDILETGIGYKSLSYKITNNIAYTAQEWVADVEKTQGADAARTLVVALSERFPDIRQLQKIVSRNFDQEARVALDAGDFPLAAELYAKALAERPNDRVLKQNAQATWDMWARVSLDKRDWSGAMDVYEKALNANPNASSTKRNMAFVAQEWSRDVAKAEGAAKAEALLESLSKRFKTVREIERQRGQIVGREITALIEAKDFANAATALSGAEPYFKSKSKFDGLTVNVYYRWTEDLVKAAKWEDATEIYAEGFAAFPKNSKLKNNVVATWHAWADTHMSTGEWQQAIDVYEQGLAAMPNVGLFKQNIAYCKSKL